MVEDKVSDKRQEDVKIQTDLQEMIDSDKSILKHLARAKGELLEGEGLSSRMKPQKTDKDIGGVLAVIPCYNEEATIGSVIVKARRYVDEILVVDDGSSDDTAGVAKELGASVVSHSMNRGKSAGVKTGF
ncbi:MAG: glycosyltransferase family 2 protein, partial [Candidatus Thermoplasmatota archaeon]